MQAVRRIIRAIKTPVMLLLLLAFVGYGAAWGYEHATAPLPPRPLTPCVPINVGDTLTPQFVQVRVLNGGNRGGLAKNTATFLRAYDFRVIKVNNTDERLANTVIVGNSEDDPEVRLVAGFFKDATVRADGRADHVVDVLLGDKTSYFTNPKVTSVAVDGPVCLPADTKVPTPTPTPTPSPTPTKKR